MANIVDYLAWRGDVPFGLSPWNEVDGLACAVLSYLNIHGLHDYRGWTLREAKRIDLLIPEDSGSFPGRKKVFEAMADSARFGDCRMHHFIAVTDAELGIQFSAMCIDLPDGTMGVLYRGTDNTLIGWREDFNMAYQTRVPAQEAAAYYLEKAAEITDRPLRLVGHSKGGNLAVYAAACVPEKVQERVRDIWSYDGPGMNMETARSEGYARISGKIRSFIPQTSIIGLLMEYFKPYTVVRSDAKGIEQHDPLTWQVYGRGFETMESVDSTASVTCDTLHEWLANSTPEQRGAFVEGMFRMADNTNATKMSDLLNEKFKSLRKIVGGRKDVDPEIRRIFNRLMAQAVSLGFGNVIERVRGKTDGTGSEEWTTMDPKEQKKADGAPGQEMPEGGEENGPEESKTGLDKTEEL